MVMPAIVPLEAIPVGTVPVAALRNRTWVRGTAAVVAAAAEFPDRASTEVGTPAHTVGRRVLAPGRVVRPVAGILALTAGNTADSGCWLTSQNRPPRPLNVKLPE